MAPRDYQSVQARARKELPVLNLSHAAICLHFVDTKPSPEDFPHEKCVEISSMELDLLAYSFQDHPPFVSRAYHFEGNSHLISQESASESKRSPCLYRCPITIHYPSAITYYSEGRTMTLESQDTSRQADVMVSSTYYRHSQIRIWHIVISPPLNGRFNEFDLIKLIHLYDGSTEKTRLKEHIEFSLEKSGRPRTNIQGLPEALGLVAKDADPFELRCGTVQILTGSEKPAARPRRGIAARLLANASARFSAAGRGKNPYTNVLETARRARDSESEKERRQFKTWMENDCHERRVVKAYCGIITGIFDFDELDYEEALDTLEPSSEESSAFLRIHRRTLISIAESDRSMKEVLDTVGVSPYLILPHAALIHNEVLIDSAKNLLEEKLQLSRAELIVLDDAYANADKELNIFFLPNVFNYVTERELFDNGFESRGSKDKRVAVMNLLEQLKSNIEIRREARQQSFRALITWMLLVVSLFNWQKLTDYLISIFWPEKSRPGWQILLSLVILLVAITGLAMWRSEKSGSRRQVNRTLRIGSNSSEEERKRSLYLSFSRKLKGYFASLFCSSKQ